MGGWGGVGWGRRVGWGGVGQGRVGYNIGDTTAIWQMNTMLSTCNTEGGGCIPHIMH